MKTNGNRNIWILALTLVVVMLGYGIVMPILPFYVENMGAGGTELGLLVASYAAMRLVFGPIWGSWSDRLGRKPILMVGVLGYGIAMVLFGMATKLWMLFAARIFSGILSSATSPTTMAYISDSTPPSERGRGMGILGAAVGAGTIFGPGLGGLLGGESLATPFFLAGGLSLLSVVLIWLLLPESLPEDRRSIEKKRFEWRSAAGQIRRLVDDVWLPMLLAFLMTCGMMLFFGIFGLYAEDKFGYGTEEVGGVFMLFGLVTILGQGILTGPLTKKYGEVRVIQGTLLLAPLGMICIALSQSSLALMLSIGFFTLAAVLLTPAVTSLISQRTSLEQGITMGWSNSVISLGRIVGPAVGGLAFDSWIEAPLFLGAGLLLLGFVFSLTRLKPGDTVLHTNPGSDRSCDTPHQAGM